MTVPHWTAWADQRLAEAYDLVAEVVATHAIAEDKAENAVRHCDDCDYSTTEADVTVCPDQRCRGHVG